MILDFSKRERERGVGSDRVWVSAWIALAAKRHDSRILPGPWSPTLEFYPQTAPVISQPRALLSACGAGLKLVVCVALLLSLLKDIKQVSIDAHRRQTN